MFIFGLTGRRERVIDLARVADLALTENGMTRKDLALDMYGGDRPDEARLSRALSGEQPLDLGRLAKAPWPFQVSFLTHYASEQARRFLDDIRPTPARASLRSSVETKEVA